MSGWLSKSSLAIPIGILALLLAIAATDCGDGEDPAPAPENLTVSLADGTFSLSWDAVAGATNYRVQYRTGADSDWTGLDTTTETSQTWTPADELQCGATYEFQVQTHGDGVAYTDTWGSQSGSVSERVPTCYAPELGSESYTFTLAEDAAVDDVVVTASATDQDIGDTITYEITSGNDDGAFSVGADGVVSVASELDHETIFAYLLTVEVVDSAGLSDSASVSITVTDVDEVTPPVPDGLTAALRGNGFDLSWNPVDGAEQYRIQYQAGTDAWANLDAQTGTTQNHVPENGIRCGVRYGFRVQAHGDGSVHPALWGSRSSIVIPGVRACIFPKAPTGLSAAATSTSITLTWVAPADSAVTGYQILRRRPDHGEMKLLVYIEDTGNTDTSYTDMAVQPGTKYVYRVNAVNGTANGPQSNGAQITPPAN